MKRVTLIIKRINRERFSIKSSLKGKEVEPTTVQEQDFIFNKIFDSLKTDTIKVVINSKSKTSENIFIKRSNEYINFIITFTKRNEYHTWFCYYWIEELVLGYHVEDISINIPIKISKFK